MTNVTDLPEKLPLSAKQQLAIKEILTGKTDKGVAEVVGVSRKTINEWKNYNPYFQAELNDKQEEAWDEFIAKYWNLNELSFNTIQESIKNGDVKTAIWFMEKVGLGKFLEKNICIKEPDGDTVPDEIIWQFAEEDARRIVGIKAKPLFGLSEDFDEIGAMNEYLNEDEIEEETEKKFWSLVKEFSEEQQELLEDRSA